MIVFLAKYCQYYSVSVISLFGAYKNGILHDDHIKFEFLTVDTGGALENSPSSRSELYKPVMCHVYTWF